MPKSTPEQIRARFDADVERFSNLETGQSATMDAPLVLELVVQAAAAATPRARAALDLGCGAGNYSLKLLQALPNLDVTLLDLSRPMLERAAQRVQPQTTGRVTTVQADLRAYAPGPAQFDVILAAAVLHHLRADAEWQAAFAMLYAALRPGGSVWIADLVAHEHPGPQAVIWQRYGEYLTSLRDTAYRDTVFAYIEAEDSPRPLTYQLDRLRAAGFAQVDVLHKRGPFAAFGAVKGGAA
ncbi:MAG: class I SAM-dependent methyltransferase [Anaerolineales bacterium]|nr:class I SAM-dependent methyltransferase [Anaerolineales bacterium]